MTEARSTVTGTSTSTRRSFLKTTGLATLRVGSAGALLYVIHSAFRRGPKLRAIDRTSMGILRPPGALDEGEFLAACIRCDLCAQACDTHCIQFFGPAEGKHAGTPFIMAEKRACNLCLECTLTCPSGALCELKEVAEVEMGLAVVDTRLCVSHNGTGACGACHTICPLKNRAITQGLYNAPTIHPDHCVGCGLCEEVCIVDERRAIRVASGRKWS